MLDVDIWRAARGGRPGVLEPSHQQKKRMKKMELGKKNPRPLQHQQQRKPDGMNNQPMNKQPYAIHVSGNMFAVISTMFLRFFRRRVTNERK